MTDKAFWEHEHDIDFAVMDAPDYGDMLFCDPDEAALDLAAGVDTRPYCAEPPDTWALWQRERPRYDKRIIGNTVLWL